MKNFSCFKNTKKSDASTEPDYKLSVNIGSKEQPVYRDCGGGWLKDGQKGKFISFQLSKPFNGKPGWKIVEDNEG